MLFRTSQCVPVLNHTGDLEEVHSAFQTVSLRSCSLRCRLGFRSLWGKEGDRETGGASFVWGKIRSLSVSVIPVNLRTLLLAWAKNTHCASLCSPLSCLLSFLSHLNGDMRGPGLVLPWREPVPRTGMKSLGSGKNYLDSFSSHYGYLLIFCQWNSFFLSENRISQFDASIYYLPT